MLKALIALFGIGHYWVGAQKRGDGKFYWQDCTGVAGSGETCSFTQEVNEELWIPGQPDGDGIYVNMYESWAGFLNDRDDYDYKFICEYKLT